MGRGLVSKYALEAATERVRREKLEVCYVWAPKPRTKPPFLRRNKASLLVPRRSLALSQDMRRPPLQQQEQLLLGPR